MGGVLPDIVTVLVQEIEADTEGEDVSVMDGDTVCEAETSIPTDDVGVMLWLDVGDALLDVVCVKLPVAVMDGVRVAEGVPEGVGDPDNVTPTEDVGVGVDVKVVDGDGDMDPLGVDVNVVDHEGNGVTVVLDEAVCVMLLLRLIDRDMLCDDEPEVVAVIDTDATGRVGVGDLLGNTQLKGPPNHVCVLAVVEHVYVALPPR